MYATETGTSYMATRRRAWQQSRHYHRMSLELLEWSDSQQLTYTWGGNQDTHTHTPTYSEMSDIRKCYDVLILHMH